MSTRPHGPSRSRPWNAALVRAAFACLVGVAACTGSIPNGSGSGGARSPGSGGSGGDASANGGARPDPGVVGGPTTPEPGKTCAADAAPGRTTIRRLTRDEFDFSVRDLLADDTAPGRAFPDDDSSDADLLTFSTLLLEKVEAAANQIVDAAWQRSAAGKQPAAAPLFVCAPSAGDRACGERIVKAFARRAFRAPPSADDLAPYLDLIGSDGVEGTKAALVAILLSPRFLYRLELDPVGAAGARPLTAHEVAARLSYALWASVPDARLDGLADSGALLLPGAVEQEASRMLRDPKADALTTSFAARWLSFDLVQAAKPDPVMFPDVDAGLLRDMRDETASFVRGLFAERGSLLDLVSAPMTTSSAALAKHYGPGARKGVLGQGAFLVTTSTPVRTSAVKRGKWVLGRLLCMPPAPPPPGAAAMKPDVANARTERERLALHRTDPKCGACHNLIDPIGLALEGYDAAARLRTDVGGVPLDLSGALPGGRKIDGAGELADALRADRDYAGCVSKQLLTWALGRQPDEPEACVVGEVTDALAKPGATTAAALTTMFRSRAFLYRQPELEGAPR